MSLVPGTTPLPPCPRALVVDDEEAIRSILHRYLSRRGWEVDLADDGDQALRFLHSLSAPPASYDLIIADMRMERMGGAELHRWLREHRPETLDRFVVSTGDAGDDETLKFLNEAQCRVLEKPFELPSLAEMVSTMLLEKARQAGGL